MLAETSRPSAMAILVMAAARWAPRPTALLARMGDQTWACLALYDHLTASTLADAVAREVQAWQRQGMSPDRMFRRLAAKPSHRVLGSPKQVMFMALARRLDGEGRSAITRDLRQQIDALERAHA